jgi:hypothetical protein
MMFKFQVAPRIERLSTVWAIRAQLLAEAGYIELAEQAAIRAQEFLMWEEAE